MLIENKLNKSAENNNLSDTYLLLNTFNKSIKYIASIENSENVDDIPFTFSQESSNFCSP